MIQLVSDRQGHLGQSLIEAKSRRETLVVLLQFRNLEEGIRIAHMVGEWSSVRCRVVEPGFRINFLATRPQLVFSDQRQPGTRRLIDCSTFRFGRTQVIGLGHLEGVLTAREKAIVIHDVVERYRKVFICKGGRALSNDRLPESGSQFFKWLKREALQVIRIDSDQPKAN